MFNRWETLWNNPDASTKIVTSSKENFPTNNDIDSQMNFKKGKISYDDHRFRLPERFVIFRCNNSHASFSDVQVFPVDHLEA